MGQTVTPVSRQDSSIHGQTTHPGTSQTEPATQNGAGGRGYAFLVAYLVALSAFGSFVNDMYIPTLPEMARFFGCSASTVQLGLTSGMAGLGAGQILMGPLSDKYGRKPILFISMGIFIAGAVASVFSPGIMVFLGWRFVQGIGAAGGYFLARTVPADIYGGRPLAKMMALIGAINGFAPASAPVLGGLAAKYFGWKGISWILAAFAIFLFVAGFRFKESLPRARRAQGKWYGTFREYGPLLRNPRFMTHVMLKGTGLGLLFAYISAAPFIMQDIYGYSEVAFGCFMGVNALFMAAGSMVSLRFKILKDASWVGCWILMLSTTVVIISLLFIHDFWAFEISMLPMLFALGMIFTVGNTLSMNEGRINAGAASAILGVVGYIFGAIVAPLVGLGEIRRSSAIVFGVMAVLTLIFGFGTRRMAPDLNANNKPKQDSSTPQTVTK